LPSEQERRVGAHRADLPAEVFGEPFVAPVSDGTGQDRVLLKKANDLFVAAGCTRKDGVLCLPDGTPLEFEFLDNSNVFERHTQPFIKNLKLLGVNAHIRRSRGLDIDGACGQLRRRELAASGTVPSESM
jgi:microcin C transport system substrate-binding protein